MSAYRRQSFYVPLIKYDTTVEYLEFSLATDDVNVLLDNVKFFEKEHPNARIIRIVKLKEVNLS